MNVRAKLLTLLLVLAMMPFSATAQDDPPDIPAGWEIGIDSPQDTAPIFEIGLDGEVSVKFWIDNQNLASIKQWYHLIPESDKRQLQGEGNYVLLPH